MSFFLGFHFFEMERHAFLRAELLTPGRLTAPEDQVFCDEHLVRPNFTP